MKLLFCGLGQIARRHIGLLQKLIPDVQITALRSAGKNPENLPGVQEVFSWSEADKHSFDAALITSPTHQHIAQASECVKRGMPVFMEKPLGASLEGLDDLLAVVEKKNLPVYVAYCFRFHPLVQEFKKRVSGLRILHSRASFSSYMPSWRTKKNYQNSYIVHHGQGGGVILDCSHEIDTLEFLFGEVSKITGTAGRVSGLTVDAEDYADMLVKHPQGTTPLHLDFFSRVTQRYVEVDTADTFYRMDLKDRKIISGQGSTLKEEVFAFDPDIMYAEQLRYFFSHLEAKMPMMNNLADAARLLKVILNFRDCVESGTGPKAWTCP